MWALLQCGSVIRIMVGPFICFALSSRDAVGRSDFCVFSWRKVISVSL